MKKSTHSLASLLGRLAEAAERRGLTDTEWAARAKLRKETLSRLRRRTTCDLSTLQALAAVVGAHLNVGFDLPDNTPDGHFPVSVLRVHEERLVDLVSSGTLDAAAWKALGPPFFMAGMAVMLASRVGVDRQALLQLAEQLHPGISEPSVFALWLERSPLRPSRFFPLVEAATRRAA